MADLDALNGDHADDATWVLTSSFVILTMQSGFGMLEMGSSSKGHEVNIVLKNIFDVVCGALAYYCVGYGISYGSPSNPFMGTGDYFIDTSDEDRIGSGLVHSKYIFQFSPLEAQEPTLFLFFPKRIRCKLACYEKHFAFFQLRNQRFCSHLYNHCQWLFGHALSSHSVLHLLLLRSHRLFLRGALDLGGEWLAASHWSARLRGKWSSQPSGCDEWCLWP